MDESEQDRSEQPTPLKLRRAREKGSIARSVDLGFFAGLAAFFSYAWLFGERHLATIAQAARDAIVTGTLLEGSPRELMVLTGMTFSAVGEALLIMGGMVFAVVLAFEFAQTGIVFTAQPLKADFTRLNPAQGLKRIFSVRMLIETGKSILKLLVYSAIAYLVIDYSLTTYALAIADGRRLALAMAAASAILLLGAILAALVFAALDQFIVRRDYRKRMRMSRRELKREVRDREGEPRMKQRRKQLHSDFAAMSESLRNLKGADVLIVNPHHFAIGLKYDRTVMAAPTIVSRGANRLALTLRRIAFIHGVVTVHEPALALALFRHGSVGREIPESLYADVARVYRGLADRDQDEQ